MAQRDNDLTARCLLIFGFALAAAYCPAIYGGATSPRWFVAAVAMIGLVFIRGSDLTCAHAFGILFIGWSFLTLQWSSAYLDGVGDSWKFIILGAAFVGGTAIKDPRPFYRGLAGGLAISSALALLGIDWPLLPSSSPPGGLFVNRLFLGEIAALVFVAALGHRLWWSVVFVAPSVILTHGRGPLLALGTCAALFVWTLNRRLALCIVGLLASVLIVAIGLRINPVIERINIWRDVLDGVTWLGHGFGSFMQTFTQFQTHTDSALTRTEHAHNELLEILYETGPLGAALVIAFAASLLWALRDRLEKARVEHYIFIAFLVEACFAFPLRLPTTAVVALFAAGSIARDLPRLRDTAIGRRVSLRIDACASRLD